VENIKTKVLETMIHNPIVENQKMGISMSVRKMVTKVLFLKENSCGFTSFGKENYQVI